MNVNQGSVSTGQSRKGRAAQVALEQTLTIGELAKAFQVSLRTLRFYEDRGLIAPRREGTARYYSDYDKSRIELILKGKELGFSLAEIKDMLRKGKDAHSPLELSMNAELIAEQISHLERQKVDTERAIRELRGKLSSLKNIRPKP